MNINYNESSKCKTLFSDIFDIESIFNKFKIDDIKEGEYITLQNIKYSIYYIFKEIIKKKELITILKRVRKEIQKSEFANKLCLENNLILHTNIEKQLDEKPNYSYNLIEKSEFIKLIEIIHRKFESKVSNYNIIFEFYYNFASETNSKKFHYKKINNNNIYKEKELIDNDNLITCDIFIKKVSQIFPNIDINLIKYCFNRLDVDNIGYIKLSSLEKFFFI